MKGIKIASKLAEAVDNYHKGPKADEPAMKEDSKDLLPEGLCDSCNQKMKNHFNPKHSPKAKQPDLES